MPDIDIKIVRHGDPPPWTGQESPYLATDSWKVVLLEGGMSSGLPSVALELDVPGVGLVIAQTSLAAWSGVTIAGRGAFPEAFRGGPLAEPHGYLWKQGDSMPAKTVVYQDSAGEWRWKRVAANGEIIADSSEGYVSESNALRAAETVFDPEHEEP